VTLCLVTDRRRLVPDGASDREAFRCLAAQARYAAEAGVDLIHVRERDLEAAALASIVMAVLDAVRGTAVRVVVNDRLDVAVGCGAQGVHLRGDSISVAAARRVVPPGFLVGRSVHTVADAQAASGADYLVAGTVFRSISKAETHALLGLDGLTAIVRASTAPVLAIGGVTAGQFAALAAAGASGAAAIGLFMRPDGAPGDPCRATALADLVARARRTFDSVNVHP